MKFRKCLNLMIITARIFYALLFITILLMVIFNLDIYYVIALISSVILSYLCFFTINIYTKVKYDHCPHYITFIEKWDGSAKRRNKSPRPYEDIGSTDINHDQSSLRNDITDPAYQGLWHNIYNDSQR